MATASLNVIRPWWNLANPGASSPGNTAAAAATSAAPAPAYAASPAAHSASTASCDRASAAPASRHRASAAAAAATATPDQHEVVLERFVGFSIEDVERCQADIGDFFLA